MLGQVENTGSYVSVRSRHTAHVLPALAAGIIAVHQLGLPVVLLAVPSQHVQLPLQDCRGWANVRDGQGGDGAPEVPCRVVHLTGQLAGVELLRITHPSDHVEVATQNLHAVQGPVQDHVGQAGGSSLWVVEEHGQQTLVVAVEAS